jgi:hypothetical protein
LKKIIAIALLALHMFNLCGHMLLYQYAVYKSDIFFEYQVSHNLYNVNDLVEVKLPVDMPHSAGWPAFESIHGQVKFKEAAYNYVKMKLSGDTIYLMCVPNYKNTRLTSQNIIDARQIANIPVNKKDHVPFGKMFTPGNYSAPVIAYRFSPPVAVLHVIEANIHARAVACHLPTPEQPPRPLA